MTLLDNVEREDHRRKDADKVRRRKEKGEDGPYPIRAEY